MAKPETNKNHLNKFVEEIVYLKDMNDDSQDDLAKDIDSNEIPENSDNKNDFAEEDDVEEIYSIHKHLEEFDKQEKYKEAELFLDTQEIACSSRSKEIYFYLKEVIDNKNIATDIKNILFQIIIHKLLYNMLLTTSEISHIAEKCHYICSISDPDWLIETYNQAYDNLLNDIKINKLKDSELKYLLILWLNEEECVEEECVSSDQRIDLINITSQIIIHKLLYKETITPLEITQIFQDETYLDENYEPCFSFLAYEKIYDLFNATNSNWNDLLLGLEKECANTY